MWHLLEIKEEVKQERREESCFYRASGTLSKEKQREREGERNSYYVL